MTDAAEQWEWEQQSIWQQRKAGTRPNHRPRTINMRRVPAWRRRQEQEEEPATDHWRPRTRADCSTFGRPCPYVGCRHHLYLNITRSGSIGLQFEDLGPEDLTWSCALDVIDHNRGGPLTLEEVGALMNLTRERIRQVEERALARARAEEPTMDLADHADDLSQWDELPAEEWRPAGRGGLKAVIREDLRWPDMPWQGHPRHTPQSSRRGELTEHRYAYISECIRLNPGCNYAELRKLCDGYQPGECLADMHKLGLFRREGHRGRYLYYPPERP